MRGGPVTYASSVTWFWCDCVALLKCNGVLSRGGGRPVVCVSSLTRFGYLYVRL